MTKVTSGGMAPGYIEYFLDEVTPGSFATNFWLESYRLNGEEGTRIRHEYDDDGLATKVGDLEITRSPTTGLALGTDYRDTNDAVTRDSFGELATYRAGFDDHQCQGNPPWSGCVELLKEEVLERDHYARIKRRRETMRDSLAATPVQHLYEYTYDADTGRLEEVERDGATWEIYAYDDNGNRTSWTDPWGTATAVYDDQDRLTSTNTASYAYTANGELLTKTVGSQTVTYTYDVLGNLTHVALPSGIGIDYVTDARNRRIAKKVNGTVTEAYLYGLGPAPLAKLDGAGNVVARYVYGTRSLVPDVIFQGSSSYRLFTDRLGSVRTVVNAETGDVVQRLDYDAYGRVMLDTNPGFQPWGYAGGLYDYQTSLVRFGARDYDAEIGRWTAKDPVGFGGGELGLFAYCGDEPVNHSDASGLGRNLFFVPSDAQIENRAAGEEFLNIWASVLALSTDGPTLAAGFLGIESTEMVLRIGAPVSDEDIISSAGLGLRPAPGAGIGMGPANPVPSRMARVVDGEFLGAPTLAGPGASEAFVTAADDISGINSAAQLADRLTLLDSSGAPRPGPFAVFEFDTPGSGVASPILRDNPGFVGGGLTMGGAREFTLPNLLLEELENLTTRLIP